MTYIFYEISLLRIGLIHDKAKVAIKFEKFILWMNFFMEYSTVAIANRFKLTFDISVFYMN